MIISGSVGGIVGSYTSLSFQAIISICLFLGFVSIVIAYEMQILNIITVIVGLVLSCLVAWVSLNLFLYYTNT